MNKEERNRVINGQRMGEEEIHEERHESEENTQKET
jgi:hypothetical protein